MCVLWVSHMISSSLSSSSLMWATGRRQQRVTTKVIIIGAGFSGLSVAYHLMKMIKKKKNLVLLLVVLVLVEEQIDIKIIELVDVFIPAIFCRTNRTTN